MALVRGYEEPVYRPDYGTVVLRDAVSGDEEGPGDDVEEDDILEDDDSVDVLDEHFSDAIPGGTLVLAGAGWLRADAMDAPQRVRLELHDGPPPLHLDDWDDVGETPYASATGGVAVDMLINTDAELALTLSGSGLYRVRVSRRDEPTWDGAGNEEDEDDDEEPDLQPAMHWLLQFWRSGPDPDLPRRLRRSEVPDDEPRPGRGWSQVLEWPVEYLATLVGRVAAELHGGDDVQADLVTVDDIGQVGERFAGERGWLDQPLHPAPERPAPTGHADLDAEALTDHDRRVSELEAKARQLARVAEQLGVPAPRTSREALDLLAACGLLRRGTVDGRLAYGRVPDPPRVEEVLQLGSDQSASIVDADEQARLAGLAGDVAAIAWWRAAGASSGEPLTVRSVARHLLVPVDLAAEVLAFAERDGLVAVRPGLADPDVPLTLTPLPAAVLEDEPQEEPSAAWEDDDGPDVPWSSLDDGVDDDDDDDDDRGRVVAHEMPPPFFILDGDHLVLDEDDDDDDDEIVVVSGRDAVLQLTAGRLRGSTPGPPPMPRGAPPIGGGYVTRYGGAVAVRSGRALPLGDLPVPRELYESVAGLVAVTYGGEPSVLLRWDGSRETLGRDSVAKVGEDGRLLAFLDTWGRASRPRHRLTVLDLVDEHAAVMPWDEHDPVRLVAVQGGTVHLSAGDQAEHHVTWRAGEDPRRVGEAVAEVDPMTGTTMRPVRGRGAFVRPPGAPPQWFELGSEPHLAPGGRRLWTTRVDPPALTLFPVAGTVADAQVCWLPGAAWQGLSEIVWEDEVHALVPVASVGALEGQRIVRVDTTTGRLESAWEDVDDFWDHIVLAAPYLVRDGGD